MNRIHVALLLGLLALAEGCASTLQAKPAHQSSLFQDHAKRGIAAEAVVPHVHAHAKVDWSAYDKIQLRPVMIWGGFSSQLSREAAADLHGLANAFYDMLYQRLSQDYVMAEHPAPGSMLIQATITHAEPSWVAPALLSKVSWQLQALNSVWTYFRGKPAFAGEITVEFTVHDSLTGELLFAGTDRRVGGQNLFNKKVFNSWGDVQNSLEFWTAQAAYHLCVARGGSECSRTKA